MARLYDSRKRILAAGAARFVGWHLRSQLLERGHKSFYAVRVLIGAKRDIDRLDKFARFKSMRHDTAFPLFGEADRVCNLACPASPGSSRISGLNEEPSRPRPSHDGRPVRGSSVAALDKSAGWNDRS